MSLNNKKRISFGSTMNQNLYTKIQELSGETGIPISKLMDKAAELLLKEYDIVVAVDMRNDKNN